MGFPRKNSQEKNNLQRIFSHAWVSQKSFFLEAIDSSKGRFMVHGTFMADYTQLQVLLQTVENTASRVLSRDSRVLSKDSRVLSMDSRVLSRDSRVLSMDNS